VSGVRDRSDKVWFTSSRGIGTNAALELLRVYTWVVLIRDMPYLRAMPSVGMAVLVVCLLCFVQLLALVALNV
jgi:hypothetical protein